MHDFFSSLFIVILFYFSLPLILPILLFVLLGNKTTSPCTELDIKCLLFCFFLQQLRRAHWVILLSSNVVQSELLRGDYET